MGGRPARRCRAVLGQSEDLDHAAEVRARDGHRRRRGGHAVGDPARPVARAGGGGDGRRGRVVLDDHCPSLPELRSRPRPRESHGVPSRDAVHL